MLYTGLQTQTTRRIQRVMRNEGDVRDGEGLLHPETRTRNDKCQPMLFGSRHGAAGPPDSCPSPPAICGFAGAQVKLPNLWVSPKRPET